MDARGPVRVNQAVEEVLVDASAHDSRVKHSAKVSEFTCHATIEHCKALASKLIPVLAPITHVVRVNDIAHFPRLQDVFLTV